MKTFLKKTVFTICLFLGINGFSQMISTLASIKGDDGIQVITNRTLHMDCLIESLAYQKLNLKDVLKSKLDSQFQSEQLGRYLIQRVVFFESKNFERISISNSEVQSLLSKIKGQLSKNSELKELWGFLSFSDEDAKTIIKEKISVEKFMEIKTKASIIPATDAEAFSYFQNNKSKFKDLKFEDIKQAIKNEISKEQSDQRLSDWVDILKRKYDVRILSPN